MAIFPGSAIPSAVSDYEIDNSLRFNSGDSAYLIRTMGTPTNNKKWTLSTWFKMGDLGQGQFLSAGGNQVFVLSTGQFEFAGGASGTLERMKTTQLFRDPGAWYHIVFSMDTTQAAFADQMKLYVNGEQVTDFDISTAITQNDNTEINSAIAHSVGRYSGGSEYWDGYLAEYYFVDGSVLDADDFGELDSDTNQWIPLDSDDVKDAVTFGTNGFYQKYGGTELADSFTDSSAGLDTFTSTGTTTWTAPTGVTSVEYLVVAGGGGGGHNVGGGGGAGGYRTGTLSVTPSSSYTVTVGAGGAGATDWDHPGYSGGDSVFSSITSDGGGGGGSAQGTLGPGDAADGGSGGGGFGYYVDNSGGSGVGGQGYAGGSNTSGGNTGYGGAGGGGSAAVGQDSQNGVEGNGGAGTSNDITGSAVTYAVGGQGMLDSTSGSDGAANTGNGGDGGGLPNVGKIGGSGIVILKYQPGTGFHTITANGDAKNVRSVGNFECDYLVVGGGGSAGGTGSGGGGGGGMRTGTTNLWNGESYTITVGAGGAGTVGETNGNNGEDSKLGNIITAAGGGYGGRSAQSGNDGGAGGGAGYAGSGGSGNTPSTSPSQGAGGGAGGPSGGGAANSHSGGGGGGGGASGTAGAAGSNVSGSGNGGNGTASSISGSSVTYGGGGGGGTTYFFYSGSGGTGGGGDAGPTSNTDGSDGTDGLGGGGGGGSGTLSSLSGGDGGSGIVIVRYKSATNLATGGTITTDGDYKVHTFTTDDTFAITSATRPGTSAVEFDGTGDYLEMPDSGDWDFGSSSWTVEGWFYVSSWTDSSFIWNHWQDDNNFLGIRVLTGGDLNILTKASSSVVHNIDFTSVDLPTSTWVHLAVVRDTSAGNFVIYKDGTSVGSTANAVAMPDVAGTARINGGRVYGNYWTGNLDEFRVSNSARYTGTFTPSTTAFTADANTLLLIHSNWDGGLGADSSGNYNTFTPTNLVATDQMIDTPTNNIATLNPLLRAASAVTYSEGNLKAIQDTENFAPMAGTIPVSSGKWYWEVKAAANTGDIAYKVGILATQSTAAAKWFAGDNSPHTGTSGYIVYEEDGSKRVDGTNSAYGTAWTTAVIGVALDMDGSTVTFYNANSTQGAISFTANITGSVVPAYAIYNIDVGWFFNFGQDSSFAGQLTAQGNQDGNSKGDFYYTPPSGYLALCTDNLPDPEIALPGDNFNTLFYTGNDSNPRSFTGVGFQPDFVWSKGASLDYSHSLYDSIRGGGANAEIQSNSTAAEGGGNQDQYGYLSSFDSDGFTAASGTSANNYFNNSSYTYVAWNWKAGGAPTADNSAGAGNTPTAGSVKIDGSNLGSALAGTIAATRLSANTTAGMSVVSYTGTGSAATIGHGLSSAPELIIVKNRDQADAWQVGSSKGIDFTDYLVLDDTAAATDNVDRWNDTAPSASVFTIGDGVEVNTNTEDYIAYCFHSVEGYSKVGSYTGNASADGAFVYCGFRPAYVLVRATNVVTNWNAANNKMPEYNVTDLYLTPNTTAVQSEEAFADLLSNGFKFRNTSTSFNAAYNYIFYAVAESPQKYSNAR